MRLIQTQRGRNRRLLSGIASGLLGRSFAMVAPLLVMPAMLSYLGERQFGLWMTVVSLTSMALFMDLGLGNGLLTRLADCHGKEDLRKAREYVSSAYAVLGGVAAILLLLTLLVGNTDLSAYWLPTSSMDSGGGESQLVMVCFAAFALGIPASLIQRIQYAYQSAWQNNAWQTVGAAVSVLVTLWAIDAKLSGWIVISCYAMTPVLILGISSIIFFANQKPELAPRPKFVTRESAVDLLSLGTRFLMLSVMTSIALNLDNIIIANQLGLTAVTDYAVPAKLTVFLGMMVTVIFLPLWPANGEALARKDYAWVKATSLRMSIGGGLVIGIAASALVVFSEPIMQLWMGRTFTNQYAIIAWLGMLSVCMAISSPYHMIMNSLGALKLQTAAWAVYLAVTAALKLVVVTELGMVSVAAVSALCYCAIIVPVAFLGSKQALQQR